MAKSKPAVGLVKLRCYRPFPFEDILEAIKNARVVRPNKTSVDCLDIAVKDGKVSRLAPTIQTEHAKEIFDAKNLLTFPGCVDAHMHVGIYQPIAQDAVSESKAAAMGGVTSSLNYMRTGQYYLNRGGPYRDFMPEVLKQSDGRFWVDYGFHIAPIEAAHIDEMESNAIDRHEDSLMRNGYSGVQAAFTGFDPQHHVETARAMAGLVHTIDHRVARRKGGFADRS